MTLAKPSDSVKEFKKLFKKRFPETEPQLSLIEDED
jgi:hypothetical protein